MVLYSKKLGLHCQVISLLSIFLVCLFINSAWAIELPYINKSKIRLSIARGQAKYGEIIVENSTPEIRRMTLYLEDWQYLPAADGSKEFLPANTTPLSCAPWISFSPSEVSLPPFSKQKISYAVKVPNDAKDGGHYATLFFENNFGKFETSQQEMRATMGIVVRIATLFYVEVEGTVKRTARVDSLAVKEGSDPKTSLIQLDFYNTGNVDITCGGTFHIMNKEGLVVSRGEFNNVYTFPDKSAKLSATYKDSLPKGIYDLVLTLDLGKALEEDNFGRGPVITKETEIEVGEAGRISKLGELR